MAKYRNVKRRSMEDYAITHKKIRDARSNTEMSNKDRDRAIIMRRKVTYKLSIYY